VVSYSFIILPSLVKCIMIPFFLLRYYGGGEGRAWCKR